MKALRADHAEHLARFGILPEMLVEAGVCTVTDTQTREGLAVHGHLGADLGGILFPYLCPLTGRRVGGRVRLDHPLPDGGKYIMEQGCRHLFFPPGAAALLPDVTVVVVIVEAEKSALALMALASRSGRQFMVIAVGGCWGWRRKIGKLPLPDGGSEPDTGPSPDFELITWQGRLVILAFDSNSSTNPDVRRAQRALAHELADRGANVLIADVPAIEGVNGPDDLIAVSGDIAMETILDTARPFAECAVAEAERAVARLEADKKSDPLPAIGSIAAVADPVRRTLLIGRFATLRICGANRKFVEQQVRFYRAETEAAQRKTTEATRRGRLLSMDVAGARLLDDVCAFIQRFLSVLKAEVLVLVLWIVHTHAVHAADCTPYLSITSAEKQSGKSRLLEVLNTIVANPWYTGRVTAAVLYRKIDAEAPTLLLDESDAAFKSGEEYGEALRGILNTGHRRGGKATCCVGQGKSISYQDFSTFSPKAIAGIGELPDTVADRSIPIRLKRKPRGERLERFRLRNVRTETERLRERLEAWGAQNVERLREANPGLPEDLSDRQQDGAEPLLAIADLAGGEWPEAARRALVLLCCGAQYASGSVGTLLLSDIRQIFQSKETDRLPSAQVAAELAGIETSPWGEWSHGKPITQIGLAKLLKPFDIVPHTVRDAGDVFKGYQTADFEDAWARYLSPNESPEGSSSGCEGVTTLRAAANAGSSDFPDVPTSEAVTVAKVEELATDAVRNGVTPGPAAQVRVPGMEEEL